MRNGRETRPPPNENDVCHPNALPPIVHAAPASGRCNGPSRRAPSSCSRLRGGTDEGPAFELRRDRRRRCRHRGSPRHLRRLVGDGHHRVSRDRRHLGPARAREVDRLVRVRGRLRPVLRPEDPPRDGRAHDSLRRRAHARLRLGLAASRQRRARRIHAGRTLGLPARRSDGDRRFDAGREVRGRRGRVRRLRRRAGIGRGLDEPERQLASRVRCRPMVAGLSRTWWSRPGLEVRDRRLAVAGRDAEDVARTSGTPAYVYDLTRIEEQASALRNALADAGLRGLIRLALKAQREPDVLAFLRERCPWVGLDVCSPGEVAWGLRYGWRTDEISYTGTNLSERDLDTILGAGVHLNVDLLTQLDRVGRSAPGTSVGL